ncbi:MAG: hypothetical protein VKI83_05055 [Synechococcaceae cyanobacterium]|nr:hypothetical protein [Synechococcaceae cyanobacterium]
MSSRLLASLPRLSPLRGGLLQGRVHQNLWLEMLVAATAASALTALAAGAVVLFHERSHLAVESEETQRQLSVSLTSYEPSTTCSDACSRPPPAGRWRWPWW